MVKTFQREAEASDTAVPSGTPDLRSINLNDVLDLWTIIVSVE